MKELAAKGLEVAQKNQITVYCQRGGMRSNSVAWLWRQMGLSVMVLEGGYKRYRQQVFDVFQHPFKLILLSGSTGVGKTEILQYISKNGEQIIDLEGLAHHKGSAFGWIGEKAQPSIPQFENELAVQLRQMNPEQVIWLEAESRMIGKCLIPLEFWYQMEKASRVYLHRDTDARVQRLCQDYQSATKQDLTFALHKIKKRLGPQRYQQALEALGTDARGEIVRLVLHYYDSQYELSRQNHKDYFLGEVDCSLKSLSEISDLLKKYQAISSDNPNSFQQTEAGTGLKCPSTSRQSQ